MVWFENDRTGDIRPEQHVLLLFQQFERLVEDGSDESPYPYPQNNHTFTPLRRVPKEPFSTLYTLFFHTGKEI
jgi:hypothetical protein